MSALEIVVYGLPAPQGSKRHVGGGRMVEASKAVKPWREAVKFAAIDAIADHDSIFWEAMDGPLCANVTFFLPRPKSAPKSRRYPDRTPDLDKLLRSTFDALTDAGVWTDDARVVHVSATKLYAGAGQHGAASMHTSGARITVGTMA